MELRVLKYFLAVAREENFTKAARQLHITQPTLSRQIADLEEELGVKLFIRSNHNIILTEDGLLLKQRAQEILSLANKTKRDFIQNEKVLSGTLSIGCGEYRSNEYLAKIIAEFCKHYPRVRYEIFTGNTINIRDYIERGFLDMGLITEPVDMHKYHCISIPVKEQWGVYVPQNLALAQKKFAAPQDFAGMRLITAIGDYNQSLLGKWLGEYKNQAEIIAAVDLPYNKAMLAKENIGLKLSLNLNCSYEGLTFIPLSPTLEHSTALAWKKEQIFSPTAAAFIDFAKKYVLSITNNNI